MNSLNRFRPAKQFHCLPLVGRNAPFGYEEIVRGADGVHNYQPAGALVGAFTEMNEKGREAWKKLTVATVITVASKFTLLVGTGKNGRSYSGVLAIRTNACSHLSNSGRNSSGWTNE